MKDRRAKGTQNEPARNHRMHLDFPVMAPANTRVRPITYIGLLKAIQIEQKVWLQYLSSKEKNSGMSPKMK